jgi:hypothetical protein
MIVLLGPPLVCQGLRVGLRHQVEIIELPWCPAVHCMNPCTKTAVGHVEGAEPGLRYPSLGHPRRPPTRKPMMMCEERRLNAGCSTRVSASPSTTVLVYNISTSPSYSAIGESVTLTGGAETGADRKCYWGLAARAVPAEDAIAAKRYKVTVGN